MALHTRKRWSAWPFPANRDACDLRHNNCQPTDTDYQPGNASTPTEPTGRCTLHFRLESETRNYKGQGPNCQGTDPLERRYLVKYLPVETLEKPLHQIPDPHTNSSQ